jgi:hypothetical protein
MILNEVNGLKSSIINAMYRRTFDVYLKDIARFDFDKIINNINE